MSNYYRTHTCNELTIDAVGETVVLSGWLANKRNQGGIIFGVLRDHYGQTQMTVESSENAELYALIDGLRLETTLRIEGKVRARPASQGNEKMATGAIEVELATAEVLGPSKILPFQIVDDPAVSEATRLQYLSLIHI